MHNLDLREIREFHDLGQQLCIVSGMVRSEFRWGQLTWNVAVMMACEATMAARIAIIREGIKVPGGAALKKGFA